MQGMLVDATGALIETVPLDSAGVAVRKGGTCQQPSTGCLACSTDNDTPGLIAKFPDLERRLRLQNGPTKYSGRLEILASQAQQPYSPSDERWGTACAKGAFTDDDAVPFCLVMFASPVGLALPSAW